MQPYHEIIHCDLGTAYYKLTGNDKMETLDKKIEQNKSQYDLDR